VYASTRRDCEAARRFFQRARRITGVTPSEVITDRAPAYPRVLDELWPTAWHHVERYANNRVEADHAQLNAGCFGVSARSPLSSTRPRLGVLRPMRGIKTMTGLRTLAAGHAFLQSLRHGHYEIATDQPRKLRLAIAFGQRKQTPPSRPLLGPVARRHIRAPVWLASVACSPGASRTLGDGVSSITAGRSTSGTRWAWHRARRWPS
jgi:hypothetical protein